MRILITEDEFITRRLLFKLLLPLGKCDLAVNGLKALEAFREALKSDEKYDLVFLDIIMPKLDGIDVLKNIREMEEQAKIPADKRCKVIMTTGLADRQNVLRAANEGCDAYLIKPIIKKELYKKLRTIGILNNTKDHIEDD